MDLIRRLPLSAKGALVGFLLTVAAGLLIVVASHQANSVLMRQIADHFGTAWAQALASSARHDLKASDGIALQTLLRNVASSPLISHAGIYDLHERAVAEHGLKSRADWDYPATIMDGDIPIGHAVLTIETEILDNEQITLTHLLMLVCVVLGILAYALVAAPLKQMEQWLELAQTSISRPMQEPPSFDYTGDDALGGLLSTVQRQSVNISYGEKHAYWNMVILHVVWEEFDTMRGTWDADRFSQLMLEQYRNAATIVHLYHGELRIHCEDGISAIFRASGQEADTLFNALCAAELLTLAGDSLGARARMGMLEAEGSRWQLAASECARIDSLHALQAPPGGTVLDLAADDLPMLEPWCTHDGLTVQSLEPELATQLQQQWSRISTGTGS